MSINLASTSSSPANTQHSDPGPTPSILEDVISGLIEPRSDAPGEYKPTLIANRPGGLTMREEIGNSLATSDSFDISVAFVSAEAVLSLFEDFRSHHETATRAGTLITSTKNHFNDPRAFWELLHLQNTTGVDVRVWEGSRNASVAAMPSKGIYLFSPHERRYALLRPVRWQFQSHWSRIDHATRMESQSLIAGGWRAGRAVPG